MWKKSNTVSQGSSWELIMQLEVSVFITKVSFKKGTYFYIVDFNLLRNAYMYVIISLLEAQCMN